MKYSEYLTGITKCPFCESKERIILDSAYSFLTFARAPYHRHHLLVIPKRHISGISDLHEEEMLDIFTLQKKAIQTLKKMGYASATVLVREGNALNKSIEHVHFHVIPQIRIGDLDHYGQERVVMTEDEINATVQDIKEALKA